MTAATPTLRLGTRRIPVVLPSLRDARLHTAATILSIHAIGIAALGFRVSVFHVLVSILTAAVIDVMITFRQTGKLVWPASGMLTGSGVGLILRLTDMHAYDFWNWRGWHIYAVVAGASVLTKHLIRFRGEHLFNPSNVGLVAVFLLLGSEVVEPLDFWWAPLGFWMAAAYVVILAGGVLVTRRLHLLEMTAVFWAVLAAGLGVLSASGHCMVAAWYPEPVCDGHFWWVLVTSPEILIYQFFMITDPKTIPQSRRGRVMFSAALGILAVLLIAPQETEFGAKVALLGSLVILTPIRRVFDRPLRLRIPSARPSTAFAQGVGMGVGLTLLALAVVVAGVPTRRPAQASAPTVPQVTVDVEVADLPEPELGPELVALGMAADAPELVEMLAENLALEAEAIRDGDGGLLALAATGDRLGAMQQRVDDAVSTGVRIAEEYTFTSLLLDAIPSDGGQSSVAVSVEAEGTVDTVTYDATGREQSRTSAPFAGTFVLRRVGGERWLIASASEPVTSPPSPGRG